MSRLIETYKSVLKFAGQTVKDDNRVYVMMSEEEQPSLVNGKHMVLPTRENLKSFDPATQIIFHPLNEDLRRGQSDVQIALRKKINVRLNITTAMVALGLLNLVASTAKHQYLTPEQSEILYKVKEISDSSLSALTSQLLEKVKEAPDQVFTNIYLKRSGEHNGVKYSRLGVVNFPLYNDLKSGRVKLKRAKDTESLISLLEFMFPDIDAEQGYATGSNSMLAPWTDCLMQSAGLLANHLNGLIHLYQDHLDSPETYLFDMEWEDHFNNLDALKKEIMLVPPQIGNEGESENPQTIEKLKQIAQETTMTAPEPAAPVVQAAPEAPSGKRTLSVKEALAQIQGQQMGYPQQHYFQPQQQPVVHQPVQAPPQPTYNPEPVASIAIPSARSGPAPQPPAPPPPQPVMAPPPPPPPQQPQIYYDPQGRPYTVDANGRSVWIQAPPQPMQNPMQPPVQLDPWGRPVQQMPAMSPDMARMNSSPSWAQPTVNPYQQQYPQQGQYPYGYSQAQRII